MSAVTLPWSLRLARRRSLLTWLERAAGVAAGLASVALGYAVFAL
jgi:hypothetical protein